MIALYLIEHLSAEDRALACVHLEHSEAGLEDTFLYRGKDGLWREWEAVRPGDVRARRVRLEPLP